MLACAFLSTKRRRVINLSTGSALFDDGDFHAREATGVQKAR